MPSSGLMLSNGSSVVVGNGGSRMDGTLSQSMDSVNTVAAEEEVHKYSFFYFQNFISYLAPTTVFHHRVRASATLRSGAGDPFFTGHGPMIFSTRSSSSIAAPHRIEREREKRERREKKALLLNVWLPSTWWWFAWTKQLSLPEFDDRFFPY